MSKKHDSAPEDLLDVWVRDLHGLRKVGTLERYGEPGFAWQVRTAFYYDDGLSDRDAVSITMPVRRAPYEPDVAGLIGNLPPIFDQSLPEGALRDYLMRRYAKTIEHIGDFDLAAITGATFIGRVLVAPYGHSPSLDGSPALSLERIVRDPDSLALMEDLMGMSAERSGVSGTHPKVLYRPSEHRGEPTRATLTTGEYILKTPGDDFPWLSINEYLCMSVSARSGLPTARTHLTESGQMLIIERFDRQADGTPLGFEDGATLCARTARQKYDGSYETLVRNFLLMVAPENRSALRHDMFKRIVLSCALGDGDAHLKNFGMIYDIPDGAVRFAPAYDICSTLPYISQDRMALSLGEKRLFPSTTHLTDFGRTVCGLSRKQVQSVFDEVHEATRDTLEDLDDYCDLYPDFADACGKKLLSVWHALAKHVLSIPLDRSAI
jgi:serine/threonine-protein kinase HipA